MLDHDGVELTNFEEAIKEAARGAEDIATRDLLQGVSANGRTITIADENWHAMTDFAF